MHQNAGTRLVNDIFEVSMLEAKATHRPGQEKSITLNETKMQLEVGTDMNSNTLKCN